MAAEIKQAFNLDANLVAGAGGIFDVIVDGKIIYSKEAQGRFPEPGEVTALLK